MRFTTGPENKGTFGVLASTHWIASAVGMKVLEAGGAAVDAGDPTMAHLSEKSGDTVHIDVMDRWGNAVSATPSGGRLQSSSVVPGLGMPLNSRAQMFWLEDGLPSSLAPGRRPRTTLSPSMAQAPNGTRHAFGSPGGDQQDRWQLMMFLRLVHSDMNLPRRHRRGNRGSGRTAEECRTAEPVLCDAVVMGCRQKGQGCRFSGRICGVGTCLVPGHPVLAQRVR